MTFWSYLEVAKVSLSSSPSFSSPQVVPDGFDEDRERRKPDMHEEEEEED